MGGEKRRQGLPALVLAILYAGAVLSPLALAWSRGLEPAGFVTEAAPALGLIAPAMMLAQFVSSGRYERISGRIGIDHSMAFHKWTGRIILILVILHPILFALPDSFDRIDVFFARVEALLTAPAYLTGVLALAVVIVLVGWALLRERLPIPYEWWRACHDLLSLSAAWLAALHAADVGTYSRSESFAVLWPALAVLATAILIGAYGFRTYRMTRRGWRVASNEHLAEGLWEIALEREDGDRRPFRFDAGQFAWLTFAPHRFPLLDHPFSIASSPASENKVSFIIKEAGDFTNTIGSIAIGTRVGVDAPHGSFGLAGLDADAVLLVAGGAGIAPIMGLLRDLAANGDKRPVRLVYAGRTPNELVSPQLIEAEAGDLDFRRQCIVEHAEPDWPHQIGLADRACLTGALDGLPTDRTAALICGPGPMVAAVSDTLEQLGLSSSLIRYERFDYAGGYRSAKDKRVTMAFRVVGAAILAIGTVFALR